MTARKVPAKWRGGSLQSLVNRSTTTGAGYEFDLRDAGCANFAAACVGASTAFRAKLQGSADGSNWFDMKTGITASTTPSAPTPSTTNYPVQFVRLNVTTKTTSPSKSVQGYIIASPGGVSDASTASATPMDLSKVAGSAVKTGAGTSTGNVQRVVVASDQNVPVNIAQIAGGTIKQGVGTSTGNVERVVANMALASGVSLVGSTGNATTGTLRVVLATNQPSNTNALLVGGNVAEDAVAGDGDKGIPAMVVRKATPVNTSGTDGDYEMLQVNGGLLWVQLGTLLSGEDQTNSLFKVEHQYSYSRKTADGQVKASAGFVHALTFGATGTVTAGVITLYDNTAESGTVVGAWTIQLATAPVTILIDSICTTGIYLGYDGTIQNVDVTASYR